MVHLSSATRVLAVAKAHLRPIRLIIVLGYGSLDILLVAHGAKQLIMKILKYEALCSLRLTFKKFYHDANPQAFRRTQRQIGGGKS